LGIPLIAINTLQILSYGFLNSGKIKSANISDPDFILCPMIDARRMEVYRAFLNNKSEFVSSINAEIINENSFSEELLKHSVIFFGSGAEKCRNIINNTNAYFFVNFSPNATYMISLAYDAFIQKRFEDTAYFEPFYLKDFMATVPKKRVG
jgi:tRNA threonylcarbamoyladenosine biosynthesis protein TsaB